MFKNSRREWTGVPIMAANMYVDLVSFSDMILTSLLRDTVGTFEMAKVFSANKMVTCIHKHYSVADVRF